MKKFSKKKIKKNNWQNLKLRYIIFLKKEENLRIAKLLY